MCYSGDFLLGSLVGPYAKVHTLEWTNTRKKFMCRESLQGLERQMSSHIIKERKAHDFMVHGIIIL